MKNSICFGLAMFLAVGVSVGAMVVSASAMDGTEASYDLGKVVVSEKGQGVEAIETASVITAKDIKQSHARTLDEALALTPGLNVRVGGDGTPRIDIRGFRTRNVLLLLNGTPFNGTYDGQFDPADIPVENIAEIRVITGGASVLYGPGGNGGVINIITKKGKKGVHGSVGAEAGEREAYLVKGTLSGASGKMDAFASASAYKQKGFVLSNGFSPTADEDGGLRENSARKRNNLFANVGYTPSDKTFLGMTFSYLNGERGKPPVTNHSNTDPFSSGLKFERVDASNNYSGQVAMSHDTDGPLHFKGWLYLNKLYMLENRYDDANYVTQVKKNSSRTDSMTQIGGANFQTRFDLKQFGNATWAVMAETDDWTADGFVETANNVRTPFSDNHDFQVYSTMLEYSVSPIRHLGVVFGFGYHWQVREQNNESDYSYLVGAHYDLFPGTRLKAYHSRKIRFPSLKDLYDPDGGNPDLTAERSLHYEAGIEQHLPAKTVFSLTGFLTDVDNFIEKDAGGTSRNYAKYHFIGYEIAAENRFVENLMVRAAYSFLDTKDESPGSTRADLQYRPRDKVSLEGNYRFPSDTAIHASMNYVAHQYFYDKNNVGKKELPAYTIVDAKVSQGLMDSAMDIYFGVNNIFDCNYEESYGLPQAGRTFYAGLDYRF